VQRGGQNFLCALLHQPILYPQRTTGTLVNSNVIMNARSFNGRSLPRDNRKNQGSRNRKSNPDKVLQIPNANSPLSPGTKLMMQQVISLPNLPTISKNVINFVLPIPTKIAHLSTSDMRLRFTAPIQRMLCNSG
jgi:hypothetical protein